MISLKKLAATAAAIFLLDISGGSACEDCGRRGGPGYRLPSGHCASWAQHERQKAAGDFPAGARCEQPQGCRLETSQGIKLLGNGEAR